MKKLIAYLLFLILAFSLFADSSVPTSSSQSSSISQPAQAQNWWQATIEDSTYFNSIHFRATLIREKSFALGGGLSTGLETKSFQFALYGLGDYFLDPIGGLGGAASLEFMVEAGATFAWKIATAWITTNYLAIDAGYFVQFAKIPQDPDTLFVAKNCFVLRPKFYTLLQITKHYKLSIGLYYQIPIYPQYSDYKGVGVSLGLMK